MNRLILAAAFAALGVCATAETTNETLIVPPYPAAQPWKAIESHKGNASIWLEWVPDQMPGTVWREWIPATQTPDAIRDLVAQQTYTQFAHIPPTGYLSSLMRYMAKVCRQARINGPVPQVENGYQVAYGQFYCVGEQKRHQDIDSFIKVIGGKSALYIVLREFYRPEEPGAEAGVRHFTRVEDVHANMDAQKTANDFLGTVQLCPLASGSGECPSKAQVETKPTSPEAQASLPQISSDVSAGDRDPFGFFTVNTSKAGDVRQKLGKPEMENHNPDGRFVYIYKSPAGVYVTYLFDPSGTLIHIRGYMIKQ
jgi:hypothetical protein